MDQKTIVIDNFKNIKLFGVKDMDFQYDKIEKGQLQELEQFALCLKGSAVAHFVDRASLVETAKASFVIQDSISEGIDKT